MSVVRRPHCGRLRFSLPHATPAIHLHNGLTPCALRSFFRGRILPEAVCSILRKWQRTASRFSLTFPCHLSMITLRLGRDATRLLRDRFGSAPDAFLFLRTCLSVLTF